MSTTSKVMHSVRGGGGGFRGAKENGQCYYSDGLDSLATEAIEGLHRLLQLLLVITHFLKVDRKSISAWLPLSIRIFDTSHRSMWTVSTIALV
jgi:hypothetical protein